MYSVRNKTLNIHHTRASLFEDTFHYRICYHNSFRDKYLESLMDTRNYGTNANFGVSILGNAILGVSNLASFLRRLLR